MTLALSYTRTALKDLRGLPATDRTRTMERLDAYAADPAAPGQNVVKLAGVVGGFRPRVGLWRALFTVTGDGMVVSRIRGIGGRHIDERPCQ